MPRLDRVSRDQRCIVLGDRPIEYVLARRPRRRGVGLKVDANGLTVNAPVTLPLARIEAFVRESERWVLKKLAEWSGKRGRYGIGGAYLAARTGTPILPIAHNAGEVWGRYAFRKRAGLVTVVIGPLIQTAGRDAADVNAEVEAWIEGQMRVISPERYAAG